MLTFTPDALPIVDTLTTNRANVVLACGMSGEGFQVRLRLCT